MKPLLVVIVTIMLVLTINPAFQIDAGIGYEIGSIRPHSALAGTNGTGDIPRNDQDGRPFLHDSSCLKRILLYTTRDYGTGLGVRRWDYDEDLVTLLGSEGFDVTVHDRETIPALSQAVLSGYDQLWLVSTESGEILGTDEVQAVNDFHDSGHGIMIIGDSQSYDGPANQLSAAWGVTIGGYANHCGAGSGCPISTSGFPPHDIWNSVSEIQGNINEGDLTAASPAQVIAVHSGYNMVAVLDDSGGRVVWDATVYRFTDASCHPDISIADGDNARYAGNIARWLQGYPPIRHCIGLLVENLSSLDSEECAAYSFALEHGFSVSLIDPGSILTDPAILDGVDALWAANDTIPEGFDDNAVSEAIKLRLENGKGLLVTWYGSYLVQFMNVGTAAPGDSWSPVVSDHEYWVDTDDTHPIFEGIASWIPPEGPPDDEARLISYVTPGIVPIGNIELNMWIPSYRRAFSHIWATYGWCGQSIDTSLCDQYGVTCTCERSVQQSSILEARLGDGSIMVGPYAMAGGDHWNWGPVGYEILENMLDYLCVGTYQWLDREILLYTTRDYGDVNGIARRGAYDENLPDMLEQGRFNLTPHDRESIPALSQDILSHFDQLWFVSTESVGILDQTEIDAIDLFHACGKGVMVIGDSYTYDGPANLISSKYGVSMSGTANHCSGGVGCPVSTMPFTAHEIWYQVDEIEANINEGHITAAEPANVIASHNGYNMVAIRDAGGGRMAWDATYYRFSDVTSHPDISIVNADNARYTLNLAIWLDGGLPLPGEPYIGLFADVNRDSIETCCEALGTGFNVYVYCLPSRNGQTSALFRLGLPSNVYLLSSVTNSFASIVSGDVLNGIEMDYSECQFGWNWPLKIQCMYMTGGWDFIDVLPHPTGGNVLFETCTSSPMLEEATIFNRFGVNDCGIISTQLASFRATSDGNCIMIEWSLRELGDNTDFIIFRSESEGDEFKLIEHADISWEGLDFTFKDENCASGKTYIYKIDIVEEGKRTSLFTTDAITAPAANLVLSQNHPNPFNPSTTIEYHLPDKCKVRLEIFDVTGKLVSVLIDAQQSSGPHSISWNGFNTKGIPVTSGIYLYRLTAGKTVLSRKMILLR